jgi:glycerol-3-phosphate dehydrogenase (NAD(P)+)
MNIAIAGAGGWGTALAVLLKDNGHNVTLWGHDPAHLARIEDTHKNEEYLPGITISGAIDLSPDLEETCAAADLVVVAVPSKAFRDVSSRLAFFDGTIVSVTKGIEYMTGLTMCGILAETCPRACHASLSGPTLALEVARGMPSAIVAASRDISTAQRVQHAFHCSTLRVYTCSDLLGVELGGALKNVIAIGAGVCDGLGFGDNSKAALLTRAIVEIRRLGVACGAQGETFSGLSGLGDLTVTCFSRLSRNRAMGERLGKGEKLSQIQASTLTVAEGCPTARSAYHLARKLSVTTPIIDEVYRMLHEDKDVKVAVRDLMSRDSKSETAS